MGAYRSRDGNRITAAARNNKVKRVDLVSELLTIRPRAQERPDLSRVCGASVGIHNFEGGARLGGGGHQIGARGRFASFVANLTYAYVSRFGLRGRRAKAQSETKKGG